MFLEEDDPNKAKEILVNSYFHELVQVPKMNLSREDLDKFKVIDDNYDSLYSRYRASKCDSSGNELKTIPLFLLDVKRHFNLMQDDVVVNLQNKQLMRVNRIEDRLNEDELRVAHMGARHNKGTGAYEHRFELIYPDDKKRFGSFSGKILSCDRKYGYVHLLPLLDINDLINRKAVSTWNAKKMNSSSRGVYVSAQVIHSQILKVDLVDLGVLYNMFVKRIQDNVQTHSGVV